MTRIDMTEQRLAEIVAAYGASPDRWPASERQAAVSFLAQAPKAQAYLDAALELDELLDVSSVEPASEALMSRIMAARPRPVLVRHVISGGLGAKWRALGHAIWPNRSPIFPVGAFAVSAFLGIMVVMASPSTFSTLVPNSSVTNTADATASDQLVELALAENEYPEEWKHE